MEHKGKIWKDLGTCWRAVGEASGRNEGAQGFWVRTGNAGWSADDQLLQWRLATWAVVCLRCRKKMDPVMALSNALFRSGEAGGKWDSAGILLRIQVSIFSWWHNYVVLRSSLPNFQLWVLCMTQRIWWQKHSTCCPYCWPQEFQAVLSPLRSPILLSAHRWSLV